MEQELKRGQEILGQDLTVESTRELLDIIQRNISDERFSQLWEGAVAKSGNNLEIITLLFNVKA